jgi:serine phosphatase RsbU (regulator of sigma subunit)
MQEAARRFAQRVLVIHLILLVVVVGLVVVASREVYYRTRAEAMAQARERQELLASQTARGVESYYQSIIDNLDLLRTGDPDDTPDDRPPLGPRGLVFAPVLWTQLEGRISHLFVVDTTTMTVHEFGRSGEETSDELAAASEQWLRSVEGRAISPFRRMHSGGANLVVVPVTEGGRRLLVAVVPVRPIEQRFLDPVNREEQMSASLLDASLTPMATARRPRLSPHLERIDHPIVRKLVDEHIRPGRRTTLAVEEPVQAGDEVLPPHLVTVEPVHVLGKRWSVLITSDLADVDAVVSNVFGRAVLWAVFVIGSMMAILVSTAVQLIRGRLRLERVQLEVLEREVSQARQIQLAWLPDQATVSDRLNIAAVNQPASHISGDFYNWFELPDGRTAVVIGDVTGHGMAAAFLMATTQLLVRTNLERLGDPGHALEEVNRQLCSQVFNGQFVTLLLVVLDLERGRMDLSTAGHFPPLVSDGEGFHSLPMESQLVLGIEPSVDYQSRSFDLSPGSSLLLYTDGVLDVQSPDGSRFDADGLHQSLYGRYESAQAILDSVLHAVDEFRQEREPSDDLTIVAVQLQDIGVRGTREPAAAAV